MSSTTFSIAEQLQIQYSEFEDRLIVVAHLKQQQVKLLLTRRLAVPLVTQLVKWVPNDTLSDLMSDEPLAPVASRSSPAQGQDGSTNTSPPAPMFLATKIDLQPKDEGFVVAFTGLSLPDAMINAQPHQPVFAIPFSQAKLGQFESLMRQQIEKAGWWVDAAPRSDPFEVMPSGLLH
ncbi:hypothetical protein [Thiomicrospira microaerophila]|uniref:hypothetical protein n=1 Tax=Thiomicrospira microaerophila TaxID=406020 RepID=UPI0005CB3884|nr:hypothetical protein [Thiomicrospira microaerophila]